MAQDKMLAQAKPPRPSFADSLRRKPDPNEDALVLTLPSVVDDMAIPRPGKPGVDLSSLATLWLLIGPGGNGKTTLARWLGGKVAEAGALDGTLLAALDPTNRTLADFFEAVEQPPNANSARVVTWLKEFLAFVAKQRINGIMDFGGGDTSLTHVIASSPRFTDPLDDAGVAAIATYMLSPRVDDLTVLGGLERQGFQPRATALVLNMARADNPDDFDPLRRHPAYKAALDRGAVELWMPKMEPKSLAFEIERRRAHFFQVRDGVTPPGSKPADITPFERMIVGEWLRTMDDCFSPVATWIPRAAS